MKKQDKLKVYYDGLCRICSKEMDHYRQQLGADKIEFVNICDSQFDASSEGLDPKQIHKIMHVRRADGAIATRVYAFIEIWKALPKYQRLAKFVDRPFMLRLLNLGYSIFAFIRPWLPRKKSVGDCDSSPYCDLKP